MTITELYRNIYLAPYFSNAWVRYNLHKRNLILCDCLTGLF